jgi:hypothetical protein
MAGENGMENNIEIYKTADQETQINVRFEQDTVWLTQQQMANLFEQTKQNISLHINNCFKEEELHPDAVVKESLTTAADGKKYRTRYYNLDVIISVGYRVKSKRGTQFRQWATKKRLKEYFIVKNHSFIDGNKRIAAACFLYFLERNGLLCQQSGETIISNEALTSLTLFIAVSKPEEMQTVKQVAISILNRKA